MMNLRSHNSKNNYFSLYRLVITLVLLYLGLFYCIAQNKMSLEKCSLNTIKSNVVIPSDKGLLVFNSLDLLSFKSQRNNSFFEPNYVNGQYLLYINPESDVITILNRNNGLSIDMKFTKENIQNKQNTYPVIKIQEKLCFDVKTSFQLVVSNSEGDPNFTHKNALIIIKTVPTNLGLTFQSTKRIIDTIDKRKDEGKYFVFLEPGKQTLTIGSKYFDEYLLSFDDLKTYPVVYYNVSAPDTTGYYSIKTSPSGALIEIDGLNDFNSQKNRSPFVFNIKCGHYQMILTKDKYDTIKDEINVCDPVKKESVYNFIPSNGVVKLDVHPELEKIKVITQNKTIFPYTGSNFEFPKGNVNFVLQAPGYKSDTVNLVLSAGDTISLTKYLIPLKGMEIFIYIHPKKVHFQLENGKIEKKQSPIKLKLYPGEYNISLENELYSPIKTTLKILPAQTGYYYDLVPRSFLMNLSIKGRKKDKYSVMIDAKSYGRLDYRNCLAATIPAGNHSLTLVSEKENKTVYVTTVKHTNSSKKKIIWLPSIASWSLGGVGISFPVSTFNSFLKPTVIYGAPTYMVDFSVFSLYGLSVQPAHVEKFNSSRFPDNPYIFSWINPEFRLGFNITNWMDFSLFVSAYYKNNPFYEIKEGKLSTFFDIRGYKYGLAFNFFNHNQYRWSWASMTLRFGIRDEQVKYHIWDGQQMLPDQRITEYNAFVSLTMNFLTYGDGMILRIFKKPLNHLRTL